MSVKGGTSCAVRGCTSRSSLKTVTMFRFPNDPIRSKLWAVACGRGDLQEQPPSRLYTNYKVCAHHFEEKMYTNKLKNRLLPSAIPTLFPQMEGCSREPKGEKREADDDINEREIMAQLMSDALRNTPQKPNPIEIVWIPTDMPDTDSEDANYEQSVQSTLRPQNQKLRETKRIKRK